MGGFLQGLKSVLNWQPSGSPEWYRQQQTNIEEQQEQIQQQQEQQRARQADLDFHQHLVDLGAVPGDAKSGLIKDTETIPDIPGVIGGGQQISIVRKMDPARTIKFKDSEGDDVAYELPTAEEQAARQLQLGAPARAAEAAQAGAVSQASTTGAAAGQTAGKEADLAARGVLPSLQEAQQFGLNPQQKYLPEDLAGMHRATIAPTIRANTQLQTTGMNIAGRAANTQANIRSRDQLSADRNNLEAQIAQNRQTLQDAISQRTAAVQSGANPNLGRIQLPQIQANASRYMAQQDQADDIQRQVLNAQEVLSETPDGERYVDPFSGAQRVMTPDLRDSLGDTIEAKKLYAKTLGQVVQNGIQRISGVQPTSSQRPANAAQPQQQPQAGAQAQQPIQGALGPTFERQAQAIANYQEAPLSGGRPTSSRVMGRVMEINPQYQQSQYPIFQDTEKAFTTGKPAQSANALNTMMGHLDVLDRAADALKNGNVQIMNKIANAVGAQTGSTARTTYDAIVHRVGPEVTAAYVGGGGSAGERGTNEEDFSSSLSPDQIHQNISISAALASSKIKALQDQYNRGTYGRGKQKLISDEAESTRQRLAGATSGLTGAAGAPIVQHSPSTGQYRYSVDGGKTWQPGQPPNQQTGKQ